MKEVIAERLSRLLWTTWKIYLKRKNIKAEAEKKKKAKAAKGKKGGAKRLGSTYKAGSIVPATPSRSTTVTKSN